jgi:hypothetical protein
VSIFGSVHALIKPRPRPTSKVDWAANPLLDQKWQGNVSTADQATYEAVMKNLQREPGFSAQEKEAMFLQPAEQSKVEEAGALRRLNQGAASTGRFGSGGTQAGRGEIMASGGATRANMRRQAILDAARAALADRYNQIGSGEAYTLPRMGLMGNEMGSQNSYRMGLNRLSFDEWRGKSSDYQYDYEKGMELVKMGMGAGVGGVGGAMGAMG